MLCANGITADFMTNPDDPNKPDKHKSKHPKLPTVEDFDGVNDNFTTLSDIVFGVIGEMKEHSDTTNKNLTKLAEETSQNLNKLADDMKAILSSQTMMLTICIILICFVVIVLKGAFDTIANFIL